VEEEEEGRTVGVGETNVEGLNGERRKVDHVDREVIGHGMVYL